MDDPRVAALEALFVPVEIGAGRWRLTLPEIASGGWGGPEDGPTGTRERVSMVKAALISAILGAIDGATPELGAVLDGIVRAEKHERAALVRERDEALAALAAVEADRREADQEIDHWKETVLRWKTKADEARAEVALVFENLRRAQADADALRGRVVALQSAQASQLVIPGCEAAAARPDPKPRGRRKASRPEDP